MPKSQKSKIASESLAGMREHTWTGGHRGGGVAGCRELLPCPRACVVRGGGVHGGFCTQSRPRSQRQIGRDAIACPGPRSQNNNN